MNDAHALPYDPALFSAGIPVLGICYGLQLIVKHYGGAVGKKGVREDGQFTIDVETSEGGREVHASGWSQSLAPPLCAEALNKCQDLTSPGVTGRLHGISGVDFGPVIIVQICEILTGHLAILTGGESWCVRLLS